MSHEEEADWGLLSVADVLGDYSKAPKPVDAETAVPNEVTFPLVSLETPSAVIEYSNQLVLSLEKDWSKRTNSMEEIYQNRSLRLKHSLLASQHIRKRIAGAVESFTSAWYTGEHSTSIFKTLTLLCAALDSGSSSYCDTLLDSICTIDWKTASSSSCMEVLDALTLHIDEHQCLPEQRLRVLSTKLSLALHSKRLSALVRCLLLDQASHQFATPFQPSLPKPSLSAFECAVDSFLTRQCILPHSLSSATTSCFFSGDVLSVVCGEGMVVQYESMGMMGTRLLRRDTIELPLNKGETIIHCSIQTALSVHPTKVWRYSITETALGTKQATRSGTVVVKPTGLSVRSSRCYFSFHGSDLACLLCSETSNIPQRRCFVTSTTADTAFSVGVAQLPLCAAENTLWRDATNYSRDKALYFTSATTISVGRVTLKDHYHPFCVELWVYPRNIASTQTVVSFGNKGVDEVLIELEPSGDGVLWRGGARTPQIGSSFASFSAPGKLSSSERWWHIALNFTGATWELWLDDQFVSRQTALVSPEALKDAKCVLGKNFVGFLAEVRVWDTTRTAAELHRDSRRPLLGVDEVTLCGYYPLNEHHGDVLVDYSRAGQHASLAHGTVHWCSVVSCPVAQPEVPRLIPDFLPLAHVDDPSELLFALTPHYYCVGSFNGGDALTIFQYNRDDHVLACQIRVEIPANKWVAHGISYNDTKGSLLCWAATKGSSSQLVLWDVHNQGPSPVCPQSEYSTIWDCGKDLLRQSSQNAQRFLSTERYLADQLSWHTTVPALVVDPSPDLIPSLLRLADKAFRVGDEDELVLHVAILLHANLFFRYENNAATLLGELGGAYDGVPALLATATAATTDEDVNADPPHSRDAIVRLAFMRCVPSSGLLRVCCRCFLTEQKRMAFVKSVAGRARDDGEEKLFVCLIEYYGTVQACHDVVAHSEYPQTLYNALILEATYQVNRCLRGGDFAPLQRTSRCLEVFQEILFAKVAEKGEMDKQAELVLSYCKTLLRACDKTIEAVVKAMRKQPPIQQALSHCLELSHVGALLPSFTVSLPFLPSAVLAACASPMQACRESLLSLADSMTEKAKWTSDLGVALTFSLCLIGCSLLNANPDQPQVESMDQRYTSLLRGGIRKAGSERDVLLKNLQQGVGAISKVFEDMQKKSGATALRVIHDAQLQRVERQLMAAACALMVPTSSMKDASQTTLEPAFRYVVQLRPWVLSRRQESSGSVALVEERAAFLAQFEACCKTGAADAPTGTASRRLREATTATAPVSSSSSSIHSAQHKWKRMLRTWKTMRVLKTRMSAQEETDGSVVGVDMVALLQSDTAPGELKSIVEWRSQKARYRLSGLLLLKQLAEEARIDPALARLVLPVMAKAFCGWHYAEGVDCCSSEDVFRLHGAFFQLMDVVIGRFLLEKGNQRSPWATLLMALATADYRLIDFRKIRGELTLAFRTLWGCNSKRECIHIRVNGALPDSLRGTKFMSGICAPFVLVGESGLTLKATGGRGTCVAPCSWQAAKRKYSYYYEVHVVDLLPGGSCCIGAGPMDYGLSQLPGWDTNSYGLHSEEGVLFTGSTTGRLTGFNFGAGDTIGCGWDLEKKELLWTKNGRLIVSTSVSDEELSPLVGFDGKGIAKVNFGAEPFLFTAFPGEKLQPISSPNDAWDAFRAFSMRAALCLKEACGRSETSAESLRELSGCAGHCFQSLAAELDSVSGRLHEVTGYVRVLLSHMCTLAQLLVMVPLDSIGPHSASLAEALKQATHTALQHPSVAVRSELLTPLLNTWYRVMHLVPQSATSMLPDSPQHRRGGSASVSGGTRYSFLNTLVHLAARLCISSRSAHSPSSPSGSRRASVLTTWWGQCDEAPSMALALLQRVNEDCGAVTKADGGISGNRAAIAPADSLHFSTTTTTHTWADALHEWIIGALRRCNSASSSSCKDAILALAVLGGGARLAVPGDVVCVQRAKHSTTRGTLISYSLREEICEVLEEGHKCSTLPLRLVDVVVSDDGESCYFPCPGSARHEAQAREACALAERVLDFGVLSLSRGIDSISLYAQLLSVLRRGMRRGVVSFPPQLVSALVTLADGVEQGSAVDVHQLRVEKAFTEYCGSILFQRNFSPSASVGTGGGGASSDIIHRPSYLGPRSGRRVMQPSLPPHPPTFTSSGAGLDSSLVSHHEYFFDDLANFSDADEDGGGDEDDASMLLEEEDDYDNDEYADDNLDYVEDSALMETDMTTSVSSCDTGCSGFGASVGDKGQWRDGVQLAGGHLRLVSGRAVGLTFSVDLRIRATDIYKPQLVLAQPCGAGQPTGLTLIARICDAKLQFGYVPSGQEGAVAVPAAHVCAFSLLGEDTNRWVRVSMVRSGTTLSLFRGGVLIDSKRVPTGAEPLLQEELFVGGMDGGHAFIGCIKGLRIYDVPLRAEMVERLHSLSSSLATFVESHLCVLLGASREYFGNYARTTAAITTTVLAIDDVGSLDTYPDEPDGATTHDYCIQELDFTSDTEATELFSVDTTALAYHAGSCVAVWNRKKSQSVEQLSAAYNRCWRQLAGVHSVAILTEVLHSCVEVGRVAAIPIPAAVGTTTTTTMMGTIVDLARRSVLLAAFSTDTGLLDAVTRVIQSVVRRAQAGYARGEVATKSSPLHSDDSDNDSSAGLARAVVVGEEALRCLLGIAQREQRARVYESTHPYRPSTKVVHEIHVPDQSCYQVFFDPRSLSSNMLLTFAADEGMTNIIAQAPGFALTPFTVQLPRVFFDIRSDTSRSQWGYKVAAVYNYEPQLKAMQLFQAVLSSTLSGPDANPSLFPFLGSPACLEKLTTVVKVNAGRTRRLALSCLCDLLLLLAARQVPTPHFSRMHELRRMAERQCRKRTSGQTLNSCFVEVVVETGVAYRDASHSCPVAGTPEVAKITGPGALGDAATGVMVQREREEFMQRRLEQRTLYRQRDSTERMQIQKVSEPQNVQVEWSAERVCVVRADGGTGGAVVAGTPLTAGRWYLEARISGPGDVFIGVTPPPSSRSRALGIYGGAGSLDVTPVAFNGLTGAKCGESLDGDGSDELASPRSSVWRSKDYVGVVIDVPLRTCSFYVNGQDTGTSVRFGIGEGTATAAAATTSSPQDDTERSFIPYFALASGEVLLLNFGASHFDFEVPRGCLPLDPAYLLLGSLLPHNQLRAFQDLTAHVITRGAHPVPPFFYDEADPFAESTERTGPAHVSLHAVEGVQVNLLEVKNIGSDFQTIMANCAVRGGAWYYEVTLRTQGLMQIGWTLAGGVDGGVSVGDSSVSWSIDLFRRVRWHNGRPEAVNVPRRWNAGDVIGCALDVESQEMSFFLNGRHITSGTLAHWTFNNLPRCGESGVEYVPAISLRAGNAVAFNFGSVAFKYKPEGFNALGVSDSWTERMDTFYANESATSTLQRQRAMRDLWILLEPPHGVSACEDALKSYCAVTAAVDDYCQDTSRTYSQMTEDTLKQYLMKLGYTSEVLLRESWMLLATLLAVARVAQEALPFLYINTRYRGIMTRLFLASRPVLFRGLRHHLIDAMIRETNVRTEHFRISINRVRARAAPRSLKSSVFGQTFAMVADLHPRMFQTNKRFWNTVFMGEGAEDVGGPFREHVSELCRELMSTDLPLFVPTANNTHNTGSCRDAFVPAAGARHSYELAAFEFLGRLMGGCLRNEEPLGLFFPPLVWRYLCCYPVREADVEDVDQLCLQCVREFRGLAGNPESKDAFDDVFDTEHFVTRLSDGTMHELILGGAATRVTYEQCGLYAEALLEARLHEFDTQLDRMRAGMLSVLPEMALLLFTPEELELRVCGKPDYAVEELRKGAIYEGVTSEDRRVQLLWQALEEATAMQRRLFLRFVSGRDRLPIRLRIIPLATQGDADMALPRAATCFFAIELPDYGSLEVMKRKLYYSIENCADMDTDFNARVMDENEGPHLVIGLDEGRSDEVGTNLNPEF